MYFNRKRLDILMFQWNCVFFRTQQGTLFALKFIGQSKLNVFLFERNWRLQLQYFV